MLVYGDRSARVDARDRFEAVSDAWRAAIGLDGLARHQGLVAAFILAAELLQGLADADFAETGADQPGTASDAVTRSLQHMARDIAASWESGFTTPPRALDGRDTRDWPRSVTCKEPEGYAFYALYPEAYAVAARGLPAGAHRTIGLRSIGTGLAAMVASRTGAPVSATLRPHGPPFRRVVTPGPRLEARLMADRRSRYAIVDEGPGLSGSSFGSVCDWLEDRGVETHRITLFTGHGNPPGPEADPRHLERWSRLDRRCVTFEDLVLRAPRTEHRLEHWISDLLGQTAGLVADLSGGAWRGRLFSREEDWPAVDTMQERRKFLFETPSGRVLARFAGLGRTGERKLARARTLFEAGLAPEPLGFVHGFLVERWLDGARPLTQADGRDPALPERIARYVGLRARAFPAARSSDATLAELAHMALQNTSEAFGAGAARPLARLAGMAGPLEAAVRRIETDGRMDAHEWIAVSGARILKTDALDHHAAHDLVGCQDPAWDVAGASVEFALDPGRTEELRSRSEAAAGRAVMPELVAFYRPCWIAFRIGMATMAIASHAGQPAEQDRLRRRLDRYKRAMKRELGEPLPGAGG